MRTSGFRGDWNHSLADSNYCNIDLSRLSGCNYISREAYSRGEMYIGHGHVHVCLSLAAFPHYCTDPNVTWEW